MPITNITPCPVCGARPYRPDEEIPCTRCSMNEDSERALERRRQFAAQFDNVEERTVDEMWAALGKRRPGSPRRR